jgi:hypothetical protein
MPLPTGATADKNHRNKTSPNVGEICDLAQQETGISDFPPQVHEYAGWGKHVRQERITNLPEMQRWASH